MSLMRVALGTRTCWTLILEKCQKNWTGRSGVQVRRFQITAALKDKDAVNMLGTYQRSRALEEKKGA